MSSSLWESPTGISTPSLSRWALQRRIHRGWDCADALRGEEAHEMEVVSPETWARLSAVGST
eukprot:2980656-Heterocapsa_arctica.AAC.1